MPPVKDNDHAIVFVNVVPSTVTGTVKVPLLVVRDVVDVNVMTGAVVPLESIEVVRPVTCPVMVPTVAFCCVEPLYAMTVEVVVEARAAVVPPANTCASFDSRTV